MPSWSSEKLRPQNPVPIKFLHLSLYTSSCTPNLYVVHANTQIVDTFVEEEMTW